MDFLLLAQKDRTLAAPTAKATGLYLVDVDIILIILHCLKNQLGPLFLEQ